MNRVHNHPHGGVLDGGDLVVASPATQYLRGAIIGRPINDSVWTARVPLGTPLLVVASGEPFDVSVTVLHDGQLIEVHCEDVRRLNKSKQ